MCVEKAEDVCKRDKFAGCVCAGAEAEGVFILGDICNKDVCAEETGGVCDV